MLVLCCCCGVSLLGSFVQVSNVFKSGGAYACSEHIQMTCRCMWIYRDRENKQNRCARMSASSWCTCNDQADVCTYAHNKTRWAMFLFKARESLESMFILANDHRKSGLCCTSCLFWQRIIGNPVYPAINPKA
jgi:hypothetical protein